MTTPLLQVKNITAGYGAKPVISDISFEAFSGEKISVLGANGSGKSTLLKALACLIDINGEVLADGGDVSAMNSKSRAKTVALLSQLQNIPFDFTVRECVLTARYAHGGSGFSAADEEDLKIADECMRQTGVSDIADRLLNELSGGQLQRVYLARAFAQEPKILLLDEPLNHLDLSSQKRLAETAVKWTKEKNRCTIAVFHDINAALSFADKTLILKDGRALYFGGAENADTRFFGLLNEAYGMDVKEYMKEILKRWEN